MKVVIDCNVLVSAGRTGGVCGAVIVETLRHHQVVLSGPIVDEYKEVAGRHAHAAYRDAIDRIIAGLERVAEFVEPADVTFGLRDPDDEVYLQTASAGDAALVTGNLRDFIEPRYGSVDILSPRAFMEHSSHISSKR